AGGPVSTGGGFFDPPWLRATSRRTRATPATPAMTGRGLDSFGPAGRRGGTGMAGSDPVADLGETALWAWSLGEDPRLAAWASAAESGRHSVQKGRLSIIRARPF